jgi:hypothetical protein
MLLYENEKKYFLGGWLSLVLRGGGSEARQILKQEKIIFLCSVLPSQYSSTDTFTSFRKCFPDLPKPNS